MAQLLMVISSLAPLFVLWSIAVLARYRIPDRYWISACLALVVIPNLVLLWRWRTASKRNDHRAVVVATARDQSGDLLVYLFAMLLPLYTASLDSERDLLAVAAAFIFIVFLFWHMNLHYMNVAFAAVGYRVYASLILEGALGSVSEPVRDAVTKISTSGSDVLTLISQFLSKSKLELGSSSTNRSSSISPRSYGKLPAAWSRTPKLKV